LFSWLFVFVSVFQLFASLTLSFALLFVSAIFSEVRSSFSAFCLFSVSVFKTTVFCFRYKLQRTFFKIVLFFTSLFALQIYVINLVLCNT